MNILNTKLIYYKGGIILYRKFIVDNNINVSVKLIYIVNLTTYYVTDDIYLLEGENTLKSIVSDCKECVDGLNELTKIN